MKKGLFFILFVMVAAVIILYFYEQPGRQLITGPCSKPITYNVGTIHSGYDISEGALRQMLTDIAGAWSAAAGQELFEQNEDGSLSVNLIYDTRQRYFDKEASASSRIALEKKSYETSEKQLLELKKQFEKQKEAYEDAVDKYRQLQSQTGSSSDRSLQAQLQTIKQKEEKLRYLNNRISEKVTALNQIAEDIDTMIADYNASYSTSREFNQGNYQKTAATETINIYSYTNRSELKLVLAHEMGHALGLKHVQNSESVMYYLMKDQPRDSLYFTVQDLQALKERCDP